MPIIAQAGMYDDFADNSYRKLDNILSIQIIPSTYNLKWEKPRDLIFSIIKNEYYFPKTKSYIGHVTAEVNCKVDGRKVRYFMGQLSCSSPARTMYSD
jgi:hypothetical protein